MAEQGYPYKGVLYAGLMVKDNEFKVLEFNCRLGDPETQVLMPIMESDLLDVVISSIEGGLHLKPVKWRQKASVGVVLASRGYPGNYRKGQVINGLDQIDLPALAFHAGTARDKERPERLIAVGGRVLTIVCSAETLEEARDSAYENIGHIEFNGSHFRKDIAHPYVEPQKRGVSQQQRGVSQQHG
jgi:phosphoribosylamine--glycine ligase